MRTPPSGTARTLAALTLLLAAVFGLMSLSYPISMLLGQWSLVSQMTAALVSPDFVMGDPKTLQQVIHNYTRGFLGISAHTTLGGLALSACTLQFLPGLRRRYPRLHRGVGMVAVASTVGAMIGAMAYLWITPAADAVSGQAFAAALWLQAATTLLALGLAVSSIRRREIRAHMGWMALMMASLLTAPMLRLEDVMVGWMLPLNLTQANAGLAVTLMPQAVWVMAWWMQGVGSTDMPLLPPQPSLPATALRALVWLGMATVLHEGLLAPWGLDALAHWRGADVRLPAVSGLWALSTAALLPALLKELPDVLQGHPMRARTLLLMSAAACGALLIAGQIKGQSLNHIGHRFYWVAFGLSTLVWSMAGMVWRDKNRAQTNWRILGLMNGLTPTVWLPFALTLGLTGWSAATITTGVVTLSWGMFAWHGFVTAFGMPMPGVPATTPQTGESLA
ncbi:MAG: DUF2306 domain-containing protein [Aquabacterium sp.]|uniref:DUF2306 domain-containing protein n=1 Tax=Aquabacterium sp. TaxID=1872578 RepID=UPI0025BADCCE|nr:DUF2306 domain-containing protein [Aquabacterium sp.]MBI5926253.1 DUF2306 domain-containing protein [Aquabacterium sp.]